MIPLTKHDFSKVAVRSLFIHCPIISHDIPIILPFLTFGEIITFFLIKSHFFPVKSQIVLLNSTFNHQLSYGFSYGFPMISPFSYGFPVVSPFLPAHLPDSRGTRRNGPVAPPGLAASAGTGSAGAAETVRRSALGSTSSV